MRVERWRFAPVGVVVLACAVAACGNDEGITPREAEALAAMVGGGGASSVALPGGAAAHDPESSGSTNYSFTEACPDGGSVALSGTAELRIAGNRFEMDAEGTGTYADCSVDEDGVSLTLVSGVLADRLRMVGETSGDGTRFSLTGEGETSGSATVETGSGYSGDCQVDLSLALSGEVDLGSGTVSLEVRVTGTVCDHVVDVSLDESFDGP